MSILSGLDMLFLNSKSIGGIQIAAVIEETYTDELTITEHPVESTANITDHAFKRPREVILKCGWSNSDYAAILGTTQGKVLNGFPTNGDYVNAIYSQLVELQESRQPFSVMTSRRLYKNMLFQGLTVVNDAKTTGALMVTATLKEVILVSTKVTTLPPKQNQADPSKTGEVENTGSKQVAPATPSPGGAAPLAQ